MGPVPDVSGRDKPERLDLSGANLTEAVLLNLTMSDANLLNAIQCKAVLKQAKLSRTALWKANLRGHKPEQG